MAVVNIDTLTLMLWACAARGGHWLGGEVCGVWGGVLWTGGGPGRTWREVVQRDCLAPFFSREHAVDSGG